MRLTAFRAGGELHLYLTRGPCGRHSWEKVRQHLQSGLKNAILHGLGLGLGPWIQDVEGLSQLPLKDRFIHALIITHASHDVKSKHSNNLWQDKAQTIVRKLSLGQANHTLLGPSRFCQAAGLGVVVAT